MDSLNLIKAKASTRGACLSPASLLTSAIGCWCDRSGLLCTRLRRTKYLLAVFAGLLCVNGVALGQAVPKPTPPEPEDIVRVYSELVQTDVMVFDKQGRFVNGLKREDFDLRIDGKARPVEFFERIAAGTANEDAQLSAARGSATSSQNVAGNGVVPLDRGRTIFFFVDDLHLKAASMLRLRKLLQKYIVENLGQNDIAAVASPTGSIGFLQQLTDNKTVLRAAVERLSPRIGGASDIQRPPMSEYQALLVDRQEKDVSDYFVDAVIAETQVPRAAAEEMVKSRARQILRFGATDTTNCLAALEGLVRSAGQLPGRKLIFFFSDGFFIDDQNSDSMVRLRKITSAAAASGVVIYSVDVRGLVASLEDPSSPAPFDPTGRLSRGGGGELIASQDGMNSLARDTGGRAIFNTNALDVGINNAIKETSVYYLLAWRPDPETNGDKFRKISVNLVNHPGWTVRVRQGYFDREAPPLRRKDKAKTETVAPKIDPEVSTNVLRDTFREQFPSRDLPVISNVGYLDVPEKGMMLNLAMQVDTSEVQFVPEGTGLKGLIDIRGTVYNDHGKAGATFTDRLTITSASAEDRQKARKELLYSYQVFLPAGLYQVRAGARDPVSGKMGTSYNWVVIPSLESKQLAMSSILLGERQSPKQTGEGEAANQAAPGAYMSLDGTLHRDSVLRFIVYIYNAQRSAADAQPDVGVQVQILRDQEPVITTPTKKISTAGADFDRLPYGGDLSLSGVAPGHYIMQVSVVDRVAKTSASQRVKIEIK
ncbi:MAG TPA: VWA domain-containing protein [Pyrinomonadaceae bacterium]|nr:VWA domain-containing protein [Pyrinomonadaceae bacterium]